MKEPFALLLLVALGAWNGALALGLLALPLLRRRLGREGAWPATRLLAPLLDLLGTWAGALALCALVAGRRGFSASWAASVALVALMVTLSLYDRAVLMPSFEAAFRRLGVDARWESDFDFLDRLATGMRAATLLCGAAVFTLSLELPR